jgi:hypothetical protein
MLMREDIRKIGTDANVMNEEPSSETSSSLPSDIGDFPIRITGEVGHLDADRMSITVGVSGSPSVLIDLDVLSDHTIGIDIEMGGCRSSLPSVQNIFVRIPNTAVVVERHGGLGERLMRHVTGGAESVNEIFDRKIVIDGGH